MNWIKRHSLVAYFVLAFVITWLIWGLMIAHGQGVFEWDTALRFAIMLGITLGIVLPVIRATISKEK